MTISDEMLMAYLDNELSPDERARVDAALIADADLRSRLKRQERVHEMLHAAFAPAMTERTPERLVTAAMTTPASWRWRLGQWFAMAGEERVRLAPRLAGAMAAVAGVAVVGLFALTLTRTGISPEPPFGASGDLAYALENKLASDDVEFGPRVGVTFRAKDGAICRTFDVGGAPENYAGLACRAGDGWTVKTYVDAPGRSGAYETASAGMPQAVRDAVFALIEGEPFDAQAERDARADGWR